MVIITMAQILNYSEKERFMAYILWSSGILAIAAIILAYAIPGYEWFFGSLIWFSLFTFCQSLVYAVVGRYYWASAKVNGIELEDLSISSKDK